MPSIANKFLIMADHQPRIQKLREKLKNRRFCPHCKKDVAVSTYREHKRKFFRNASSQEIAGNNIGTIWNTFGDVDKNDDNHRRNSSSLVSGNYHPCKTLFL